jgi:hypothetical protein
MRLLFVLFYYLHPRVKPVGSPNKRPTVKSLVTMPNGRSSKLSAKASESCSRVGGISLARAASAPEM